MESNSASSFFCSPVSFTGGLCLLSRSIASSYADFILSVVWFDLGHPVNHEIVAVLGQGLDDSAKYFVEQQRPGRSFYDNGRKIIWSVGHPNRYLVTRFIISQPHRIVLSRDKLSPHS